MLVRTNESKEKIKRHEELWSKTRDLIRSITKNADDYDEKYMSPLNKMIEIPSPIIVIRSAFHENNKYYPQVFVDECLYKI